MVGPQPRREPLAPAFAVEGVTRTEGYAGEGAEDATRSGRHAEGGGWLRRMSAALVLAAGLAAGSTAANSARTSTLDLSSPEARAAAAAAYEQFDCIEQALKRTAPRGARLHIVNAWGGLWHQRLIEMASPWFAVVSTPEEASHDVEVQQTAGVDGCSGAVLRLSAR